MALVKAVLLSSFTEATAMFLLLLLRLHYLPPLVLVEFRIDFLEIQG